MGRSLTGIRLRDSSSMDSSGTHYWRATEDLNPVRERLECCMHAITTVTHCRLRSPANALGQEGS